MASRTIAITEDLYKELSKRKKDNESFTRLIYRLIDEKEKPSDYLGSWSDMPDSDFKDIENSRKDLRNMWKKREWNQ